MERQQRNRRRPIERDYDRKRAIELSLDGMKQTDIAHTIGISQASVSKELAKARRAWTQETIADLDSVLSEELTRLDELQAQALISFAGSATENNPAGDPRFLSVAVSAARQRARLLGLEKAGSLTATYTSTSNQLTINAQGNASELEDRTRRFFAQFGTTPETVARSIQAGEE